MTELHPDYKMLWALEERFNSDDFDDRTVPATVRKMYRKIRRADHTYQDYVAMLDNESALDRKTLAYALLSAASAALFLARALEPGCTMPKLDDMMLAELAGKRSLLLETFAMLDPSSPMYDPDFAAAEGEHRRNVARATERGTEKP